MEWLTLGGLEEDAYASEGRGSLAYARVSSRSKQVAAESNAYWVNVNMESCYGG